MDTSKEYIHMCEKAVEIQVQLPEDDEDAFYATITGKHTIPRKIWLPRQDQLQEMAFTEVKSAVHILRWLDAFTAKNFDTLEKYTLCAVMYTLYGKEWNGEEWVQD